MDKKISEDGNDVINDAS